MAKRERIKDLTGMKINMLTVIERVYVNGKPMWRCICECGKELNVRHSHLTGGQKSCGCHSTKLLVDRNRRHGKRSSRLYHIWDNMKMRCSNPNHKAYKDYGGRGIKVCEEWYEDFETFYKWSISTGYDENADFMKCTLDRIDTNGNYEPNNCRWVTMKEQCNNRRNNVFLEYKDKKHTVSEWAEIIGVNSTTLYHRIKKGWSAGEVLGFEYRKERRLENGKKSYAM